MPLCARPGSPRFSALRGLIAGLAGWRESAARRASRGARAPGSGSRMSLVPAHSLPPHLPSAVARSQFCALVLRGYPRFLAQGAMGFQSH